MEGRSRLLHQARHRPSQCTLLPLRLLLRRSPLLLVVLAATLVHQRANYPLNIGSLPPRRQPRPLPLFQCVLRQFLQSPPLRPPLRLATLILTVITTAIIMAMRLPLQLAAVRALTRPSCPM